ncbi:MAG: glycosyltransferase [Candidatus Paceibacterota bacterium]
MNKSPRRKLFQIITKANWGGAQRYVFELAKNLNDTGDYDITVLTGPGKTLNDKLTAEGIKNDIVPHLGRNIHLWSDFRSFWTLVKIFRRHRPDIIHLNSSKIGLLAALAGRLARTPKIIFTAHGWAFNEDRRWPIKIILRLAQWLTVIFCHQTIAVSKSVKQDMAKWPLVAHKIKVIYNGPEPFTALDQTTARDRILNRTTSAGQNFGPDIKWLGTIAELHRNKGLDVATVAIAELAKTKKDFIYVIIGEGEERIRLEKLITKLGLTKTIFLTGEIPEARTLLSAFDIFLLPSRTEALAYVALEAGLAERAIIASRVGGLPEIITDGQSGRLVPKENPSALAEVITELLADENLRQTYGQNLNQKILTDFSLERMVRETKEMYQN